MAGTQSRIGREAVTVQAMIELYCREQHGTFTELCAGCQELAEYARVRLAKCPFGEGKTTCANCAVHCYKPVMRERIRVVMRYAGPRMLYRHPVLAIRHLWDGRRKEPVRALRPARPERQKPTSPAATDSIGE